MNSTILQLVPFAALVPTPQEGLEVDCAAGAEPGHLL